MRAEFVPSEAEDSWPFVLVRAWARSGCCSHHRQLPKARKPAKHLGATKVTNRKLEEPRMQNCFPNGTADELQSCVGCWRFIARFLRKKVWNLPWLNRKQRWASGRGPMSTPWYLPTFTSWHRILESLGMLQEHTWYTVKEKRLSNAWEHQDLRHTGGRVSIKHRLAVKDKTVSSHSCLIHSS